MHLLQKSKKKKNNKKQYKQTKKQGAQSYPKIERNRKNYFMGNTNNSKT